MPVFLLRLPELLSDITFISKLESKYILKQFTIIKTSADVPVGLGLFQDYVLTRVFIALHVSLWNLT